VAFFRTLLGRLDAGVGIRSAGLNTAVHPFGGWSMPVVVAGRTADDRPVLVHQASEGYLTTMGIPLVRGRGLSRADVEQRRHVAVVNQALAAQYFGGRDPAGHVLRVPRLLEPPFNLEEDAFEVVGVVRDTVNRDLTQPLRAEIFVPYSLSGFAQRLVVRTDGAPEEAVALVRAEVAAIDRNQPISDVRSLESALDDFVFAGPQFSLTLFAVFAALGLTMAVIGVYGVIAHGVSRRTQEIGVRMALGATSDRIVSMVIAGGAKLVAAGIVVGLLAAAAAGQVMRGLIWNVSPWDPLSFAAVAALLLVVGVQATVWPALRATRVNPVAALRRD
jgi:putative ABC transport system permease protein